MCELNVHIRGRGVFTYIHNQCQDEVFIELIDSVEFYMYDRTCATKTKKAGKHYHQIPQYNDAVKTSPHKT